MNKLRLLIVDDVEDNRLVLKAICKKLDDFEIKEAQNGLEAVETTRIWHPHIVLMDIMMPIMDGYEASKIIKKESPETIVMAITAVIDPQIEENMTSVGVSAYIHKPIDKNLIRFKLQNFASLLRSKSGDFKTLSKKEALNPFSQDIRNFKTIFDITDAEAMMDFGMWILARGQNNTALSCTKIDSAIELFYELMRQGATTNQHSSIIVEENFEELFFTMRFNEKIKFSSKINLLIDEMGSDCVADGNFVCISLRIYENQNSIAKEEPTKEAYKYTENEAAIPKNSNMSKKEELENLNIMTEKKHHKQEEIRIIQTEEKRLLHQNFTEKTSAIEYIQEIGGDVLDEIRDLISLDEEWKYRLSVLEEEPISKNIYTFADGVLAAYARAINSLFEFEAFAYALSSLRVFLKEKADTIIHDSEKTKMLVKLLEHLGSDLIGWREHIFNFQDAQDIHYLDSSFFSSCIQLEGIIGSKDLEINNDNDMEFF